MSRNTFFTLLFAIGSFSFLQAQPGATTLTLPRVFQLGTNEKAYESLSQAYAPSLLEVCNGDMKVAFDKWLDMMKALEEYAKKSILM